MINMPIGYNNLKLQTYNYDGSIGDFDTGFLNAYYYGKLVIDIGGKTETFNIDDIKGIDNKQPLNGPVSVYIDEQHHLHIVSLYNYSPFSINFSSFSDCKRLPLAFTSNYVVGNDTQEHLDELYNRLNEKSNFHTNIILRNQGYYTITGLAYFYFTFSNNVKVNILFIGSEGIKGYIIGGGSGQNLKELITLDNFDERLSIEEYNLAPTPNWNANEGEAGYIENRTHYIFKTADRIQTAHIQESTDPIFNKFDEYGHLVELYIPIKNYRDDIPMGYFIKCNDEEAFVKHLYGEKNFTVKFYDYVYTFEPVYDESISEYYCLKVSILDGYYDSSTIIQIADYDYLHPIFLKEFYIPDTIARVDNYESPHIKLSTINKEHNLTILPRIQTQRYVCDLFTSFNMPYGNSNWIIQNGEYFNGTITGISEGKLVQYDVNYNTGEITLKQTTDLELIGSEVKLDVCTAGSTEAARNLELLNKAYFALGDHFTVNIDAGIGVAKFIPETGGEGHITTAEGVNVHYTIGADGSIVKIMEIDIVALYNKVEAITITVDE